LFRGSSIVVAKEIWALAFAKSMLVPPVEEKELYREDSFSTTFKALFILFQNM
jgi:hypothetical protein